MTKDLELFVEPSASKLLTRVSHFLAEQGIQSYLIGGFVRDMLLGQDTADIDIAVAADALEVAPRVAAAFGGKYVLLDEVNMIGRVILNNGITATRKKWELDFSTLRGNIEQDMAQRDFTIDAMAVDLGKVVSHPLAPSEERRPGRENKVSLIIPDLIDPFKGWDDLRQGVLRAVTEEAFPADPVRLIRAVRLAAKFGFRIDRETEAMIRHYCQLISGAPGERVREELLLLLAMPRAGQLIAYLDELGLLTAMIPELAQEKGVEQPQAHYWDVFQHSIMTVSAVDFVLREGTWEYAGDEALAAVPWSTELSQHFDQEAGSGYTRRSILKLAALLHDIAKPQTKAIDEKGRTRFLGHAQDGAAIAVNVLEKLRFSSKVIKLVEVMVKYHLRPVQMAQHELPSRRAIYRYFRDTGEAGIDLLFLSLADHLATRGQNLDLAEWQEHAQMVEYVLARHFEEESLTVPPKLIDGNDLITIFALSPGPEIGEILEAVREAQAAGEVATREEALAYVEHRLASPPSKR
ncbi:MAG TPA: HD domain-containing protein [Dehalococcoidales bacterium]|nr:HD domain-containing protein [Dehalococcoidales bacterium]